MKVTALVDNISNKGLPTEHGLSLHIRLDDGRQILFDMGQRSLFAENAERLGIRLAEVDMAVVSHGHYDHGGGLRTFLQLNAKAPVYVNRHAFEPHYSLRQEGLKHIGLDCELKDSGRLVACADTMEAGRGILLFSQVESHCLMPPGNRLLYGPTPDMPDDFRHEQSLIVSEGRKTVLFAGCAHRGIANIMRRGMQVAGHAFTHVFSGMHLVKSGLAVDEEAAFIRSLSDELLSHNRCRYFTMHCTGAEQFDKLSRRMGTAVAYLGCGDSVDI